MSAGSPDVVVFPDRSALARNAATRFIAIAQSSIRERNKFSVALSGGSTPRDLYVLLATQEFSSQVDWARVHLFWGDERCVPPEHPDSNFKMANDTLISRVPIPATNAHRIHGEIAPEEAAREYEGTLRKFWVIEEIPPQSPLTQGDKADGMPTLDLVLLGLGTDAHTASLFPHTPALHETARWVAAQYIDKLKAYRITFTPPLINAAKNILFLVAGADKAEAVQAVLGGKYSPDDYPPQLIQPKQGHVAWLLDQAASANLAVKSQK